MLNIINKKPNVFRDQEIAIDKGKNQYTLKYRYVKGEKKHIILFKTINESFWDMEINTELPSVLKRNKMSKIILADTLSGFGGFYTHCYGEDLIEEIATNLKQIIDERKIPLENIVMVGHGTGAFAAYIYASKLNIPKVITINGSDRLKESYQKKASSVLGEIDLDNFLKEVIDVIKSTPKHIDIVTSLQALPSDQGISDVYNTQFVSEIKINEVIKKF